MKSNNELEDGLLPWTGQSSVKDFTHVNFNLKDNEFCQENETKLEDLTK